MANQLFIPLSIIACIKVNIEIGFVYCLAPSCYC